MDELKKLDEMNELTKLSTILDALSMAESSIDDFWAAMPNDAKKVYEGLLKDVDTLKSKAKAIAEPMLDEGDKLDDHDTWEIAKQRGSRKVNMTKFDGYMVTHPEAEALVEYGKSRMVIRKIRKGK